MRLSLDQALEFASGSNPALRRATNSSLINGAEMRSTWAEQLLPRAQLTLFNTQFTGNLRRQALDNFGNPIANPSADWNYFSATTHNLGLSWRFPGGLALSGARSPAADQRGSGRDPSSGTNGPGDPGPEALHRRRRAEGR